MSGKRAATGTMFEFILFSGIMAGLLWSMPYILDQVLAEYAVVQTEPWLLTVNDLTWQRSLIILFSKQGFKLLALSGLVFLWLISLWLRTSTYQTIRKSKLRSRSSLEWVVEGRKSSPLLEYASWVKG